MFLFQKIGVEDYCLVLVAWKSPHQVSSIEYMQLRTQHFSVSVTNSFKLNMLPAGSCTAIVVQGSWKEGIWKLGISAVAWSSAEGVWLGTCSTGSVTVWRIHAEDKSNLGSEKGTLHTLGLIQLLMYGHLVVPEIPWAIWDIHTGSTAGPMGDI